MRLMGLISGIRLTIPVETPQRALAGAFRGPGRVRLRVGGKYALAGEWWAIKAIDEKGIRLEPVDLLLKITEEKRHE